MRPDGIGCSKVTFHGVRPWLLTGRYMDHLRVLTSVEMQELGKSVHVTALAQWDS